MPSDLIFFVLLLAATAIFAAVRGGAPERLIALVITVEAVLDLPFALALEASPFQSFSPALFALDAVSLSLFLAIALFANRLWPLVVASLQIIVVTGHLAGLIGEGMQRADWALTQFPIFLQLVALNFGILAQRRRRLAEIFAPDWTYYPGKHGDERPHRQKRSPSSEPD